MKSITLLLACFLIAVGLHSQTVTKDIYPTDDTYVYGRGGAEASVIRGLEDRSYLKSYYNNSQSWAYEVYIKFDLSSVCSNPDLIENVKLRLYGKDNDGKDHTINLFQMTDTSWDEDNLNWNTIANAGQKSKITYTTANLGNEKWCEWDITQVVKTAKTANKNAISLMLCDDKILKTASNQNVIVSFHSKENESGNKPHLSVTEQDITDLLLTDIKVNGQTINGFNGTNFNYKVNLSANVPDVPLVTVTPVDIQAQVQVTPARNTTGSETQRTTTITISNGGRSIDYKIVFQAIPLDGNDSVGMIKVDNSEIEFFHPDSLFYVYNLPYTHDAKILPGINCLENNPNQKIEITPATKLNGSATERTATIKVTSGDQSKSREYRVIFHILPQLDIYLCIGQSNMAGRGLLSNKAGDFTPVMNTYLFTPRGRYEEATNPLNKYSSVRKELGSQKMSPVYSFAIKMQKLSSKPVGLIVNARGGTSMKEWLKGDPLDYYGSALARAKDAMKWGTIKAILWHQGESDVSAANRGAYLDRLKKMTNDFRIDLGISDLYIVVGELGSWRDTGQSKTYKLFNDNLRTIATHISNSGWVSSEGLSPLNGDKADPHFDRESCLVLGERYAENIYEKIYGLGSSIQNEEKSGDNQIIVNGKHITLNGFSPDSEVKIYDILGQLVDKSRFETSCNISIKSEGIYILHLKNGENYITKKILIS